MKCELLNQCRFFKTENINDQSGLAETLKNTYREGNVLLCARRRVALIIGRERVPIDLHPDQTHLVQELISASLHED